MSTIAVPIKTGIKPWGWIALISGALLAAASLSIPNLLRVSQDAIRMSEPLAKHSALGQEEAAQTPVSVDGLMAQAGDAKAPASVPDHKMIRTSSLQLIVSSPVQASEKIRLLAERMGGYLESAQIGGREGEQSACISIRVPAARLEEAKAEIRNLAGRVESERTDARDVTKEYVDMAARLRNLRAQEAQYLQIMKSATKVKDMLDVSENLSEVRGQIELQQAEFETLSRQVETAAIVVWLRAEALPQAHVQWFQWRPLYRLKMAAHGGLDAIADYAATMLSVVLYLPVIFLWAGTLILVAVGGWKALRWARVLFGFPKAGTPTAEVN